MNVANGSENEADSSSLHRPKLHCELFPQVIFDEQIAVRVYRLEDLLKELDLPAPTVLWLDLQGSELAALKGMGEFLRQVTAAILEVSRLPLYENAPTRGEIFDFMASEGFGVSASRLGTISGNVLFVRNSDGNRA